MFLAWTRPFALAHVETFFLTPVICAPAFFIVSAIFSQTRGTPEQEKRDNTGSNIGDTLKTLLPVVNLRMGAALSSPDGTTGAEHVK